MGLFHIAYIRFTSFGHYASAATDDAAIAGHFASPPCLAKRACRLILLFFTDIGETAQRITSATLAAITRHRLSRCSRKRVGMLFRLISPQCFISELSLISVFTCRIAGTLISTAKLSPGTVAARR